jgi:hypothetical protein
MIINNGVSPVVFWRYVGFVFGGPGMRVYCSSSIPIQLVGGVVDAIHTNVVLSCSFLKLEK